MSASWSQRRRSFPPHQFLSRRAPSQRCQSCPKEHLYPLHNRVCYLCCYGSVRMKTQTVEGFGRVPSVMIRWRVGTKPSCSGGCWFRSTFCGSVPVPQIRVFFSWRHRGICLRRAWSVKISPDSNSLSQKPSWLVILAPDIWDYIRCIHVTNFINNHEKWWRHKSHGAVVLLNV